MLTREANSYYSDEKIEYKALDDMGLYTTRIGKTYFVWKQDEEFSAHIEAKSLHEAVELINKRIKKQSLILCLDDVRNDRT